MIVVVGIPAWRAGDPPGPAGRACAIAMAAATHGASVELVGRAGDDPEGDGLLIALTRAGVGHAAVLRDPARRTPVVTLTTPDGDEPSVGDDEPPVPPGSDPAPAPRLEPADVALALDYLTAFSVLVVADDAPASTVPIAADAAGFAGAHLVVLLAAGAAVPEGLPAGATLLGVPDDDREGSFAAMVGAYAAGLERGDEPARAFEAAMAGAFATPVE